MHCDASDEPSDVVYVPMAQAVQFVTFVAPGVVEYVFSGQSWQAEDEEEPEAALYVPAGHAWHWASPMLPAYDPGAQGEQAARLVAPAMLDAVPTGQYEQPWYVCPVRGLKVPCGHRMHARLALL